MKPLLETTDPRYLRRLVRALNSEAMTGNGFYAPFPSANRRCNSARLSQGRFVQVRIVGEGWADCLNPSYGFCDAYGRNITASRHA